MADRLGQLRLVDAQTDAVIDTSFAAALLGGVASSTLFHIERWQGSHWERVTAIPLTANEAGGQLYIWFQRVFGSMTTTTALP